FKAYTTMWTRTETLSLGLLSAVTLEIYTLQARHFPKIRWFAVAFGLFFAAVSVLICLTTSGIGSSVWPGEAHFAILASRFFSTICLCMVVMATLFFRFFKSVAIRQNVQTYAAVMVVFFAGEAIGN